MKAANMSLQNTTSKPRRGYCSTRTEARADDFTLTCSGHKHSSQHALLGAESLEGTALNQLRGQDNLLSSAC